MQTHRLTWAIATGGWLASLWLMAACLPAQTLDHKIPMDHPAILYSPFNWGIARGWAKTINAGAYFKVLFDGTACQLSTETSSNLPPYSQFWARVDGGPFATSLSSNPDIVSRSLLAAGDAARLQRSLAKARRGEPVTVGVIGGSITQGAAASKPENHYGSRIAEWWRQQFPSLRVELINAGIGATGSDYGVLRAKRDLLSHQPDFVVVEYAVNDSNSRASAETLEGLVRQILAQPNQPAVVLLFMMNQDGANAQEWLAQVGQHYKLPMISYRDALWPEITAGRMKWAGISPDSVHPNDRGHAAAAQLVTHFLKESLRLLPGDRELSPVLPLPEARFTAVYDHTSLLEAGSLQPVSNSGWHYDAKETCWRSDQPGSVVEFELEGQVLFTMHWVVKGPMGRARVTVDGGVP